MKDYLRLSGLQFWYNFAFCSVLFMYFQFLPFDIETQPIGVLVCVPVFVFYYKNRLKIKREDKFLMIFLAIAFIYYIIGMFFDRSISSATLSFIKLIIGPTCYLTVLKHVKFLNWKSIRFAVWLIFIVTGIEFFRIPFFFQVLDTVCSIFFRRYIYGSATRGLCILTTEPSYFVYFAMLLMYSIDFLCQANGLQRKKGNMYKWMVFVSGLATKSAIVYLFFAIYGIQSYLNCKKARRQLINKLILTLILIAGLIGSIYIIHLGGMNNRFVNIIKAIDLRKSFAEILFYTDESMGFRFIMNSIFLLSIVLHPFGMGVGELQSKWASVAKQLNIDYAKNMIFINTFNENTALDAQAYIPNVVGAIGCFSIFLILFLYTENRYKNRRTKNNILFTVSIFMWMIQSNFFNPVFWILIGFIKNENSEDISAVIENEND